MGWFFNILWPVNDSWLDKISHKLAWTSLIVIRTIAQQTKLQDTRRFAGSIPFLGLNRVGVWQKNKYYNFLSDFAHLHVKMCFKTPGMFSEKNKIWNLNDQLEKKLLNSFWEKHWFMWKMAIFKIILVHSNGTHVCTCKISDKFIEGFLSYNLIRRMAHRVRIVTKNCGP